MFLFYHTCVFLADVRKIAATVLYDYFAYPHELKLPVISFPFFVDKKKNNPWAQDNYQSSEILSVPTAGGH